MLVGIKLLGFLLFNGYIKKSHVVVYYKMPIVLTEWLLPPLQLFKLVMKNALAL